MSYHRVALSVCGFVAVMAMAGGASACSGPRPAPGAIISGPVLSVPDAQTVCVATGPKPSQWVPLRIADADPGLSVSTIMAGVFAKRLSCAVDARGAAHCVLGGEDVGQVLRQPGLQKIAQSWR